jgi:hypothetical protein
LRVVGDQVRWQVRLMRTDELRPPTPDSRLPFRVWFTGGV